MKFIPWILGVALWAIPSRGMTPSCPIEIAGYDAVSALTIRSQTGLGRQFYPRTLNELAAIPVEDVSPPYIDVHTRHVIGWQGNIILFPETKERFYCSENSAVGDSFVAADLLGRRVVYRSRPENRVRFFREPFVWPTIEKKYPSKVGSIPQGTPAQIETLATAQLRGSSSWLAAPGSKRKRFQSAQEKINRELLAKTLSGEPVNREDIQRWTELVVEAEPDPDMKMRRKSWVIRGTVAEFERDGKRYRVDMTNTSVWLEYMTTPHSLFLEPTRSEDVPQKLDEVLARFNALTESNSFEDAVAIYRDYLICHPTLDANGRVGRALLDHAMMKIGYPPVPKFPAELALVFFEDLEGATRALLEVYNKK